MKMIDPLNPRPQKHPPDWVVLGQGSYHAVIRTRDTEWQMAWKQQLPSGRWRIAYRAMGRGKLAKRVCWYEQTVDPRVIRAYSRPTQPPEVKHESD